jgi:hypothetical protein
VVVKKWSRTSPIVSTRQVSSGLMVQATFLYIYGILTLLLALPKWKTRLLKLGNVSWLLGRNNVFSSVFKFSTFLMGFQPNLHRTFNWYDVPSQGFVFNHFFHSMDQNVNIWKIYSTLQSHRFLYIFNLYYYLIVCNTYISLCYKHLFGVSIFSLTIRSIWRAVLFTPASASASRFQINVWVQ